MLFNIISRLGRASNQDVGAFMEMACRLKGDSAL